MLSGKRPAAKQQCLGIKRFQMKNLGQIIGGSFRLADQREERRADDGDAERLAAMRTSLDAVAAGVGAVPAVVSILTRATPK